MFENPLSSIHNSPLLGRDGCEPLHTRRYNRALSQFRAALWRGKVYRLQNRLLRRVSGLYDLNALKPGLTLRSSFYAGIQAVPIRAILGSEGRAADFDRHFHPISEAARERWVNMAIVHLARVPLPPIQLIRVGNAYFVRDGHHRISVGRAFGQAAIDAEVITWKAAAPLPWEPGCRAENLRSPGKPHLSI